VIIGLLSAVHRLDYHDALRKRPWLRYLALDDPGLALHVMGAALTFALLLWWTVPPDRVSMLVEEGGFIERPTDWLYLLAALAAWYLRCPDDDPHTTRAVSGLMLLFGAREMDLHKIWDGSSMLRTNFFTGDAPLDVKLAVLAVMLLALRWAGYLVLRHGMRMVRGFLRREPVATSVVVFSVVLVLSQVLDRSASVLSEHFDVHLSTSVQALLRALEELAELALPLVAMVAMCQSRYLRPAEVPAMA